MSKKPPFRVDDLVKIANPQFFVRCGYPLCKKDAYKALDEGEVGKRVKELLKSLKMESHIRAYPGVSEAMTWDYRKILDVFASGWLYQRNFGGPERTIHTKEIPELKDKVFRIVAQKFCKTGIRKSGTGCGGYWESDDYDPPYLDDVKTHRILALAQAYTVDGHPYVVLPLHCPEDELRIEACHVKKVEPTI